MARLNRKGDAMRLAVDDDGHPMPVVPIGNTIVHALSPTESVAARNSSAFSDACKLVFVYVTKRAHMLLGGSSVTATAAAMLIPPDTLVPVPLYEDDGANADYISILSASGSGDITAHLIETVKA